MGFQSVYKTLNADRNSASFFERAKHTYVDNYKRSIGTRPEREEKASALEKRLEAITCHAIPQVLPTFSEVEIGMRQ